MPVQFIFLWKSILKKKKYAEYKCFYMGQPFIDPYESMDPSQESMSPLQVRVPLGRAHTESTRHESTRMSHETHRLSVRGSMDTPMRERRICD